MEFITKAYCCGFLCQNGKGHWLAEIASEAEPGAFGYHRNAAEEAALARSQGISKGFSKGKVSRLSNDAIPDVTGLSNVWCEELFYIAQIKYYMAFRFYQYGLVRKFDPHNPDTSNLKLCFLRKRSKVIEIVSAEELVFGLTATGVCTAFTRVTAERVCFLNIAPDEVIRSLFYNKANGSLITVSVYREDNYSSLKCRSTSLEYIRRRQPASGKSINI